MQEVVDVDIRFAKMVVPRMTDLSTVARFFVKAVCVVRIIVFRTTVLGPL